MKNSYWVPFLLLFVLLSTILTACFGDDLSQLVESGQGILPSATPTEIRNTPPAQLTAAPDSLPLTETPIAVYPIKVQGSKNSSQPGFSDLNEDTLSSNQATPLPPLRFNIPTPGPAPKSLWRPPLYEPPWALSPFDHFYFHRPIAADVVNWPIPDYRYGGTFFSSEIVHTGIDIPVKSGTPVIAAASGTVIWAGYGLFKGNNDPSDPYGLAITIRHDFSFKGKDLFTVYAHLERIDVNVGQRVETGGQIGAVGTTGLTTGPHLHFEVRTDLNSYFTTLNPELWMSPPQGWGVLVGRIMNANGGVLTSYPVNVRNKSTNQKWTVYSYGKQAINPDPYYRENLVLSDLPAGLYEITVEYKEDPAKQDINIYPGAVSFFSFMGERYFNLASPAVPGMKELLQLPSLKAHP